jgi:hypothetical protein
LSVEPDFASASNTFRPARSRTDLNVGIELSIPESFISPFNRGAIVFDRRDRVEKG